MDTLDQVREDPLGVLAVVAGWVPASLVLARGRIHTLVDAGVEVSCGPVSRVRQDHCRATHDVDASLLAAALHDGGQLFEGVQQAASGELGGHR